MVAMSLSYRLGNHYRPFGGFIAAIKKRGILRVIKAANEVVNGIRHVA